jgi:hypothetical protein
MIRIRGITINIKIENYSNAIIDMVKGITQQKELRQM